MPRRCLLIVLCCFAAGAHTGKTLAQGVADPSSFDFASSLNIGPTDGFLQTPMGGQPGTSDIERPTLEELNIDDVVFYDLAFSVPWRDATFYLGGQFITMSGDGTLEQPLVTRRPFPAGTSYDAEVSFDWYRLGGAWTYRLENGISIAPLAELALMDFSYSFDTPGDNVSRSYAKPALRVGVDATIPWRDRFDAKLAATASVPISDSPMIATANAWLRYRVYEGESIDAANVFAGLSLLYIDYEDSQRLPNHIRLEVTPYFTLGFSVAFGGREPASPSGRRSASGS